jgi:hypothetical protein
MNPDLKSFQVKQNLFFGARSPAGCAMARVMGMF